jgi:hypothetical protein
MTAMVLPVQSQRREQKNGEKTIEVNVYLQATVIDPDVARRKANQWLSMHAGHLLLVERPELVLGDPLCWRFQVVRSVPKRTNPGTTQRALVGYMRMNATTGEVFSPDSLIQELKAHADTLAEHST